MAALLDGCQPFTKSVPDTVILIAKRSVYPFKETTSILVYFFILFTLLSAQSWADDDNKI